MQPSRKPKQLLLHSIQEAEMCCSMAIKKAKANCAHAMMEAKILCSVVIRDAEAWGATLDDTLQKSHAKSMSCNWKSRLLRGSTKVSLTSSLPARLLYESALQNSTIC